MDANNFSVLWTEESWVGNKTLVYIIPTKGIVSIWNKNPQTHNLILLKEKWNNISISDQKKQKQLALEKYSMSSVLSHGGLTGRSSVKSRGTQSSF